MTEPAAGDIAIVDYQLGATEVRSTVSVSGGGGMIYNGVGHLSGYSSTAASFQRSSVPMPDGRQVMLEVGTAEWDALQGHRISAACVFGRKGEWNWLALKNQESGKVIVRVPLQQKASKLTSVALGLRGWASLLPTIVQAAVVIAIGLFFALRTDVDLTEALLGAVSLGAVLAVPGGFLWWYVFQDALVLGKWNRKAKRALKQHAWGAGR